MIGLSIAFLAVFAADAAGPVDAGAASLPNDGRAPVRLTIAEVLDRIDRYDPVARARAYDQLRAEIAVRRSQWNRVTGTLGLNSTYGFTKSGLLSTEPIPPGTTTFFDRFGANLNAQLTFPIYAGNAITGAIAAAEARFDAAKLDRRTAVRDLKRAALVAYAQLIASNEALEISKNALERSHLVADITARRRAAGIATEADEARSRLNTVAKAEDLETKKGDRAVALAGLRAALMLPQDADIEPVDPTEAILSVASERDPAGGGERLEVLSLHAQLLAADADKTVAFAGWLPRLEFYGNASYGNGQTILIGGLPVGLSGATDRFGIFSGNAAAGLRLTWTGWDFFITRDQVATAEAARASAEMNLVDAERRMLRELSEARARVEQTKQRLKALAGGKEMADTSVRLARIRYETGNAIITEVIDAEGDAIGVQSRLVQARYDRAVAHLDLLKAEGHEL